MKKILLAVAFAFIIAPLNGATLLCNFDAFSAQGSGAWGAFFYGDWAASGLDTAAATFVQNGSDYDIKGQTDLTSNYVEYYFGSGAAATNLSLTANTNLSLTANTLASNVATGFWINLFDSTGSKFAKYAVTIGSGANELTATASTITLSVGTVDSGFNWSSVAGFKIVGTSSSGGNALNVNFGNMDAVPVPEPTTYALLTLGGVVVAVAARRRKSATV
jgi:hypothetical protein